MELLFTLCICHFLPVVFQRSTAPSWRDLSTCSGTDLSENIDYTRMPFSPRSICYLFCGICLTAAILSPARCLKFRPCCTFRKFLLSNRFDKKAPICSGFIISRIFLSVLHRHQDIYNKMLAQSSYILSTEGLGQLQRRSQTEDKFVVALPMPTFVDPFSQIDNPSESAKS